MLALKKRARFSAPSCSPTPIVDVNLVPKSNIRSLVSSPSFVSTVDVNAFCNLEDSDIDQGDSQSSSAQLTSSKGEFSSLKFKATPR